MYCTNYVERFISVLFLTFFAEWLSRLFCCIACSKGLKILFDFN